MLVGHYFWPFSPPDHIVCASTPCAVRLGRRCQVSSQKRLEYQWFGAPIDRQVSVAGRYVEHIARGYLDQHNVANFGVGR